MVRVSSRVNYSPPIHQSPITLLSNRKDGTSRCTASSSCPLRTPDERVRAYVNCKITKQRSAHLHSQAVQLDSALWKPHASPEQPRARFNIWHAKLAAGKKILRAINKCWNHLRSDNSGNWKSKEWSLPASKVPEEQTDNVPDLYPATKRGFWLPGCKTTAKLHQVHTKLGWIQAPTLTPLLPAFV